MRQGQNDPYEAAGVKQRKVAEYLLGQASTLSGRLIWAAGMADLLSEEGKVQLRGEFTDLEAMEGLVEQFHLTAFVEWLELPLSQKLWDFERYLDAEGQEGGARWREWLWCGRMLPAEARRHERELFFSDSWLVLELVGGGAEGGLRAAVEPRRRSGALGKIAAALHLGNYRRAA